MSQSQTIDSQFGTVRSFLWPIHRHELKKIVPMLLMFALICFNYSILRNMKDTVVVTASGAEALPFIKVWMVLPTAILLTVLFTKLSNRYSQEHVFHIMISIFLASFVLFAFVLYPCRDSLHPDQLAAYLEQVLPAGFKGLIAMTCNWTFTLFYVMCELWGSAIMSVLFWGFANEITKVWEAPRFYGALGVIGNTATIIAGQTAIFFSQGEEYNPSLPFGHDAWEQTSMILIGLVTLSGVLAMLVFRWMNKNVLKDPNYEELHHSTSFKAKVKKKLSVKESFSYLSQSKYLICIAILVVCYNLVMNLVEVVWKDQLGRLNPSPSDYNHYMSNLTSILGIVATIAAFFMSRIIQVLGWAGTALITPIMMLLTSMGFFAFLFFQDHWASAFDLFAGTTPLAIAVFFGGAQNCLSKAAKYSVFDSTKEIAFIPLSHESKLKGKAAIDGVGSRLGKSGGSLIHQGLLLFFTTVSASAPYVAAILLAVIVLWIAGVCSLGKQFKELVHSQDENQASDGVALQEKSSWKSLPVVASS